MNLKKLEEKYNYSYSKFFKTLWNDGMIDWFKGWNEPYTPSRNWNTEVYPKIKDNPPVLLHTGGDFEMLREEEMLEYEFCEWWDSKHKFIPFGQSGAGDLYAIYKNIEIDGENPIVFVWHDDNCTTILSKNFEDFIFRQMVEKVFDFETNNIGDFQKEIQLDLNSVKKYLNEEYVTILTELYNRPFTLESIFRADEMQNIFKKTIWFDGIDSEFEQDIDE